MNEEKVTEEVADVVVYNGTTLKIRSLDDLWMTQKQMAQMFNKDVRTINDHVKAVKNELSGWEGLKSTIRKNRIVQIEGGRDISREVEFYGFEFVCQVGYKVNGVLGMRFRQFATKAIAEKLNRELLHKDELINKKDEQIRELTEANNICTSKLGEAVLEISDLRQENEWQQQFVPDDADYGKVASNGYPRVTFQKGGYKSKNGKKVELKPRYLTIDLVAVAKYLTE